MMARNNLTGGGVQMETYQELLCSPSLAGGLQQQSIYLAVVNVILSLTAILGNFLILVALRKESSLHPPSKLLYRCLATTDLLVGLVSQPLQAIYWISVAYEHWNLCRYTRDAAYMTGNALCGVSLGTMTAITVDRLLALLLGLRYRQTVTLKRTNIILAANWVLSSVSTLCYINLPHKPMVWVYLYSILFSDLIHLLHKDISHPHSSGTSTSSCSITVDPTKFTEHFAIQKSGVQCTVGAVCVSSLLCTIYRS